MNRKKKIWLIVLITSVTLFFFEIVILKFLPHGELDLNRFFISIGMIPPLVVALSISILIYYSWFFMPAKNIRHLLFKMFYFVWCIFFAAIWLFLVGIFIFNK